ncbi:ATP-binding protein [Calothrix rhizosoleniae]|uniref:ATP-binding protein n=1 Tax=Calothrix rhizosoleniae TaxID=888997 RepID=UPI000B4985DC|nr:ATP-binding protein [Calothrix rhizosoleniae]
MESLKVAGELESLDDITKYVSLAAKQAYLPKKIAYKLRLAVDEIATNIIIHGYQEAGIKGDIVCHAQLNEKSLIIHLEDTGIEYDSTKKEQPDDLFKPLETREIGGLGIYLAASGVDKFMYKRIENCNRHTFVIYRDSANN